MPVQLAIRIDDRFHLSLKNAAKKVGMDTSALCRELLFHGLVSLDTNKPNSISFREKPSHNV